MTIRIEQTKKLLAKIWPQGRNHDCFVIWRRESGELQIRMNHHSFITSMKL